MANTVSDVDHTAIKINQIIIILLNITAFVFNLSWMVAVVALVMLAGTFFGKPGFLPVYSRILKPLGWVKPKVIHDNPEPHRFSQGLGGVFMAAAFFFLFSGATFIGWGLVWMVVGLAALNAFGGFCVGCFVYYWLARLKIPGFDRLPPDGTFPGMRPREMERNGS